MIGLKKNRVTPELRHGKKSNFDKHQILICGTSESSTMWDLSQQELFIHLYRIKDGWEEVLIYQIVDMPCFVIEHTSENNPQTDKPLINHLRMIAGTAKLFTCRRPCQLTPDSKWRTLPQSQWSTSAFLVAANSVQRQRKALLYKL